jgi:hypothetical protein
MTRRLRHDQSGIALVSAMLLTAVALTLGLGLMTLVDGQQHAAREERTREASLQLADAALSAQVLALGQVGLSTATGPCGPGPAVAGCPSPATLAGAFAGADYAAAGACARPLWTTSVQDDVTGATAPYVTSSLAGAAAYDANLDTRVWVRASASAQCHTQTVVGLVTLSSTPLEFPRTAVTANWLSTTNQGAKVIVNTQGQEPQRGDVSLRCASPRPAVCADYRNDPHQGSQISPDSVLAPSTAPATTLADADVDALRAEARLAGTYWPQPGGAPCPAAGELSSRPMGTWVAPVFVEGPCAVAGGGNSAAQPGVLVVVNGTYTLGTGTGANRTFYGLVYALNRQSTSDRVVTVTGNGCIQGSVVIDGAGGLFAGQSGGGRAAAAACGSPDSPNLVYDARVFSRLQRYTGAVVERNTWRVLPADQ